MRNEVERRGQRRLRLVLLLVLLVAAGVGSWRLLGREEPPPAVNRLRPARVSIELSSPVELDGMTRREVLALRSDHVARYPQLVDGEYAPWHGVFGAIQDGRPWWGLDGQLCHGPGEHAPDGPSEEARFIVNPFLLVAVGENVAFLRDGEPCVPVWPRPARLDYEGWSATAVYDLSRFVADKRSHGLRFADALFLHAANARDWGFERLRVEESHNVRPAGEARLFQQPVPLKAYLHTGLSCRVPGGCNNGSPDEPDLYFVPDALPAHLVFSLDRGDGGPAFRYILRLE